MSATVSVLKLSNDKFYIDYTENILQILNGSRSIEWVTRNPPIEIIDSFEVHNKTDIDNYVRLYMKNYGTNSTRGGIYKNIKISKAERHDIQDRFVDSSDDINDIRNRFQSNDEITRLRNDQFMNHKNRNKYKSQVRVLDYLDL